MQTTLFPIAVFTEISQADANAKLIQWEHKMGAIERPNFGGDSFHGLLIHGELVAVTASSRLIGETVGGCDHLDPPLTRDNTVELSRLCAAKHSLCRVVLRLWRETVFPTLKKDNAISYQDTKLHTGNTYRFDGWQKVGFSASGTDARSGKKGRRKWIWLWPCRKLLTAPPAPE